MPKAPQDATDRLPSPLPRYFSLSRRALPLGTRFFLFLRWRLTPYARILKNVPPEGTMLDLGCGHGLLSLAASLHSPARQVLGVDHDAARVRQARAAGAGVPRLAYREGGFLPLPPGPFAAITAIDVMHYFDPDAQARILREAFARLAPGGRLCLREVEPASGWASRWNRLYERLATCTGFTRSASHALHFRTREGWLAALEAAGFTATAERCSSALFADILFVGAKPGGAAGVRGSGP